jgi:hypothetical protein
LEKKEEEEEEHTHAHTHAHTNTHRHRSAQLTMKMMMPRSHPLRGRQKTSPSVSLPLTPTSSRNIRVESNFHNCSLSCAPICVSAPPVALSRLSCMRKGTPHVSEVEYRMCYALPGLNRCWTSAIEALRRALSSYLRAWERLSTQEQNLCIQGRCTSVENNSKFQLFALVEARLTYMRDVICVDQIADIARLFRQHTKHLEIKRVLKSIPYRMQPRDVANDSVLSTVLHDLSCVFAMQNAALQKIQVALDACQQNAGITDVSTFRLHVSALYSDAEMAFAHVYTSCSSSQQRVERWVQSNSCIYLSPGVDTVLPQDRSSEEILIHETSADITRAMVQAKGKVATIVSLWKKVCVIESQQGTVLGSCTAMYDMKQNGITSTDNVLNEVFPNIFNMWSTHGDIAPFNVHDRNDSRKLSLQISPSWDCKLFPSLENYCA